MYAELIKMAETTALSSLIVDELVAALRATTEMLDDAVKTIKKLDVDCVSCIHCVGDVPCANTEILCDTCEFNCPCRTCRDMSGWEWKGFKHFREVTKMIAEEVKEDA